MKKKLAFGFLLALVLAAFLVPCLAGAQPMTPTPVVTPVPPADPGAGWFNVFIGPSVVRYVGIAFSIFLFIAGLKNLPGLADLFAVYPKLSVITNGLVSLAAGVGVCFGTGGRMEGFGLMNCLFSAVGLFIGAAGWHFVKFSLSPKSPTPGPSGEVKTDMSPSVSRKTRETLGVPIINRQGGK